MSDPQVSGSGLTITSSSGEVILIPSENTVDSKINESTTLLYVYADNVGDATLLNAQAYADLASAQAVQNILAPLAPPTEPIIGYGAFEWLDELTGLKYILRDQSYIDTSSNNAFINAKGYTDVEVAQCLIDANAYTDVQTQLALSNANAYTDTKDGAMSLNITSQISGLTTYINAQDNSILTSANTFTNNKFGIWVLPPTDTGGVLVSDGSGNLSVVQSGGGVQNIELLGAVLGSGSSVINTTLNPNQNVQIDDNDFLHFTMYFNSPQSFSPNLNLLHRRCNFQIAGFVGDIVDNITPTAEINDVDHSGSISLSFFNARDTTEFYFKFVPDHYYEYNNGGLSRFTYREMFALARKKGENDDRVIFGYWNENAVDQNDNLIHYMFFNTNVSLNWNRIINTSDPIDDYDIANKHYVLNPDNNINLNGNVINNSGVPSQSQDLIPKYYADAQHIQSSNRLDILEQKTQYMDRIYAPNTFNTYEAEYPIRFTAPLELMESRSESQYMPLSTYNAYGYLNGNGSVGYIGGYWWHYIILCHGRILCHEFNAVSSEKIKNVIATGDDVLNEATAQIRGLELVKYRYRDVNEGFGDTYGVIAEQVNEVMPDCVDINYQRYIPNIMSAANVEHIDSTHCKFTFQNPINLSEITSDDIKVICGNKEIYGTITSINSTEIYIEVKNSAYQVSESEMNPIIFVYGTRETCPTVSKSKIFETALCALQKALNRIDELESRLQALESN